MFTYNEMKDILSEVSGIIKDYSDEIIYLKDNNEWNSAKPTSTQRVTDINDMLSKIFIFQKT